MPHLQRQFSMHWTTEETICAIASAHHPAIRGVVRLSGPDTIRIIMRLIGGRSDQGDACEITESTADFRANPFLADDAHQLDELSTTKSSRRWSVKIWVDRLACELDVAVYLWPTKASYTGQPSAELHMIGSPPILQSVIEQICKLGGRLAQPGEFTMRAFLAGRLDLAQCEAVLGVIHSETESQFESSLQQLSGGIDVPVQGIRQRLIGVLAELEAGLDFVDEDIEFISDADVIARLTEESNALDRLLHQLKSRSLTTSQPKAVLVGLPNAGKSTLFNRLSQSETLDGISNDRQTPAIVSDIAGSTRDYLTAPVTLKHGMIQLNDTAGIESKESWATSDQLTGESGYELSHKAQQQTAVRRDSADLVLYCVDATLDASKFKQELTQVAQLTPHLADVWLVLTKLDLLCDSERDNCIAIATEALPDLVVVPAGTSGSRHDQLLSRLDQWLVDFSSNSTEMVATTSVRCIAAADAAKEALVRAKEAAEQRIGHELVSAEMRLVLHELGVVAGEVHNEEILDNLFGQFCIGK